MSAGGEGVLPSTIDMLKGSPELGPGLIIFLSTFALVALK
jgi:hypothetical protein